MKYVSNDRGALPILVAILVVALVAVVGMAVYNVNKSQSKSQTAGASPSQVSSPVTTASPVVTPTPSPAASDQELITAAVKTDIAAHGATPARGSQVILRNLQGIYARADVNVAQGSGYFYLLKKNQGAWSVVFTGQNIDSTKEAQLGFPQGFTSAVSMSTVLYTY